MAKKKAKPIVAIVGRPNVGKSTLFNALAGEQISIVKDTPGITRDRIYADVSWLDKNFTLIDTGGIEPDSKDIILSQMREQAQIAIDTADVILFVVDVHQGLVDADSKVADMLRRSAKPVLLVVNKVDIASKEFLDSVVGQYNQAVKIFKCTTLKNDGFDTLKDELKGRLSIFVGQSAVGKSSIINVLLPNVFREIGSLSAKTNRGKNCTRESQIYVLENGGKIADTTGFSALELKDISKEQLSDCYAEIKKYSIDCDYNTCNHIGESEKICAVKRAVREGKINKQRFSRYTQLYNEIKEWEEKRYG